MTVSLLKDAVEHRGGFTFLSCGTGVLRSHIPLRLYLDLEIKLSIPPPDGQPWWPRICRYQVVAKVTRERLIVSTRGFDPRRELYV